MSELKEMGKPLYGVLVICKNYEKYDCCHNGTKMARGCLKDIIEKGNKDRLIFATKDPKVSMRPELIFPVTNKILIIKS